MSLQNRLFKPTPSPLEVEQQKLQQGKFEAPDNMINEISKDHLYDVITKLSGEYQKQTDEGKKKVIEARLKSIGVYFMQKEIESSNKDANQRLIKEFDDFLLGKSKYNVDPKWSKMVFWGKRKLVGPSIDDYLKTILEKKIEFDTRIGMMRRGGYIPSDIEEAWYYYLFVLCNKKSPTDMFFKPWEAFYPAPLLPPHQKDLSNGKVLDPENNDDPIPPNDYDNQPPPGDFILQDDEAIPRLMGKRNQDLKTQTPKTFTDRPPYDPLDPPPGRSTLSPGGQPKAEGEEVASGINQDDKSGQVLDALSRIGDGIMEQKSLLVEKQKYAYPTKSTTASPVLLTQPIADPKGKSRDPEEVALEKEFAEALKGPQLSSTLTSDSSRSASQTSADITAAHGTPIVVKTEPPQSPDTSQILFEDYDPNIIVQSIEREDYTKKEVEQIVRYLANRSEEERKDVLGKLIEDKDIEFESGQTFTKKYKNRSHAIDLLSLEIAKVKTSPTHLADSATDKFASGVHDINQYAPMEYQRVHELVVGRTKVVDSVRAELFKEYKGAEKGSEERETSRKHWKAAVKDLKELEKFKTDLQKAIKKNA